MSARSVARLSVKKTEVMKQLIIYRNSIKPVTSELPIRPTSMGVSTKFWTKRSLKFILEHILNSYQYNGRMFSIVTRTWNPVTGCTHFCKYCWARRLAETKLRHYSRYKDGFVPKLNPKEFRVKFKPGEFVFVSDMGDLFCEHIKDEWIDAVLRYIARFPRTYFLLLTKNPRRFLQFLDKIPSNVILGVTIETNRDDIYRKYRISLAPPPSKRYSIMRNLDWDMKFVSIEPILEFDLEEFTRWIEDISPILVYIGYDNYNNKLPEPPLHKTLKLIDRLKMVSIVVKKTMRLAWYERRRFPY